MERRVSRKHEVEASLTHYKPSGLSPRYSEFLSTLQDIFGGSIGCEIDSGRYRCRTIPGVISFTAKGLQNLLVLAWDSHWIMGVVGVRFGVIWESSQE